ncbi:hypothetical protein ACMBCM_00500 [Spiroplasma sp. K1]
MSFKKDSVLAWAGKGYDPMKLTPENLLNFYKETYILKKVTEYEDSYVAIKIGTMTVEKFILEGLPFKHLRTSIKLEQEVKVLVEKNLFNFQLEKFAKIVMEFWHYFKLETYYENHRLVFKVNQATFDKVLEVASVLEQNSKGIHITSIFRPIINFFNSKTNSNLKLLSINRSSSSDSGNTINLINKTEKSFTVKLLTKFANINKYTKNSILLMNDFDYCFFIVPNKEEMIINNGEYSFLQIIEFEVG